MAMLDVCEPGPQHVQVIVSPLFQVRPLIEQCGPPKGDQAACARARSLVEQMQGREAVIANGMLSTADGDRNLKAGDFSGAEAVWKKGLPPVRTEPDGTGIRFDLLYRLGLLYDRQKRFEDALAVYKEQEETCELMNKMMAESKIQHTDSEKAEAREGAMIMMKDLLEGQLRALVALNRTRDAQVVREKLAKLN